MLRRYPDNYLLMNAPPELRIVLKKHVIVLCQILAHIIPKQDINSKLTVLMALFGNFAHSALQGSITLRRSCYIKMVELGCKRFRVVYFGFDDVQ